MRVLSGIQPTGSIHIGNYLGAIKQWVPLQDQAETLFCIVDLHALTTGYRPAEMLRHQVRFLAATYIAGGIDPARSSIFIQSQVPAHSELMWLLSCITPLGWLNRMTQFKDKAGKHKDQAGLGLYAYPVLQAADILIYKATHVPVGADQKQHLELARDIAGAFNRSVEREFFPLPEPCILGTATRVMSLRDGMAKMSKSDPSDFSRIHLSDDNDTIASKIKKAKTDSDALPATQDKLEARPEAQNLITILSAFSAEPVGQILGRLGGESFSQLKTELIDVLTSCITPMREEFSRLMADKHYLDTVLQAGRDKANTIAQATLREVHSLLGIG